MATLFFLLFHFRFPFFVGFFFSFFPFKEKYPLFPYGILKYKNICILHTINILFSHFNDKGIDIIVSLSFLCCGFVFFLFFFLVFGVD